MSAFGLDLAGYSSGRSPLARAWYRSDHVEVLIADNNPFSVKRSGASLFAAPDDELALFITMISKAAAIVVDVPIDLQGFPRVQPAQRVWQLTKRAVDAAFGALPPLADRLGAPVARFLRILEMTGSRPLLGEQIFESYPAGSLRQMALNCAYKSSMAEVNETGGWASENAKFAGLLNALHVEAAVGTTLTDDQLDAILCALCTILPPQNLLTGDALQTEITRILAEAHNLPGLDPITPPAGYMLACACPLPIQVSLRDFRDLLRD